jgi:ABC-type amino acid transport substrate-binding protein
MLVNWLKRLLALAVCFGIGAVTANARPLEEVEKAGEMIIFVYADYAPYSWRDGERIRGIDVEIGRALAAKLGVKANFLIRAADENVDDDLRVNIWKGDLIHRKRADVMMHVPFDRTLETRAEARAVLFNPYFNEQIAVVADEKKIPVVKTFGRFVTNPIAVELDTASDFFLSNAFRGQLHPSIRRGRTFTEAVELIESDQTAALMASRAQAEWIVHRNPDRTYRVWQPPAPGLVRKEWPIGMAVREDSRDLGYALGEALATLRKDGTMQKIFDRYGVTYLAPAGQ